eukprot:evm.model.NODE_22785_length_7283_cov_69.088287.1
MALNAKAQRGRLTGSVRNQGRIEVPVLALKVTSLEAGECYAYFEVQLLPIS